MSVTVLCFRSGEMIVTEEPNPQDYVRAKALFVLEKGDMQTMRKLLALHVRMEYTTSAEANKALEAFESLR